MSDAPPNETGRPPFGASPSSPTFSFCLFPSPFYSRSLFFTTPPLLFILKPIAFTLSSFRRLLGLQTLQQPSIAYTILHAPVDCRQHVHS